MGMTDFTDILVADKGQSAHDIHLVDSDSFKAWLNGQPGRIRTMVEAQKFTGKAHEIAILSGDKADEWSVLAGVSSLKTLKSWCLAKAAGNLPEGKYRLADEIDAGDAMLGWLLAHYGFDRYKKSDNETGKRQLLVSNPGRIDAMQIEAGATALVRDLVNTPAEDMGPDQLEKTAKRLSKDYKAELTVTRGDDLEQGYPMIHAVGRAAKRDHAPRLLELEWGNKKHPRVAIVGKGVCFDSGGLDIKSAVGMRLMKKDMGGAAHALALAEIIMASGLPIRLHMLVPAVENAVAGNAFRPGDVLTSRAGHSVEIGNTDAEGRLVLGDALTKACEDTPELIIDFATLTGAARVALGPDLPAMFANNDDLAGGLLEGGKAVHDPIWQMPLWDTYIEYLSSDIADIGNSGGGFGGAIQAALFLKKFVSGDTEWAHFDTFAWRPAARPGQTKGGEALGLRATWKYLQGRYAK